MEGSELTQYLLKLNWMQEPTSSFESLIASESFQNYCVGLVDEDHARWTQWRAESPENAQLFEEAKVWVIALRGMVPEEEVESELSRLKEKLQAAPVRVESKVYPFRAWMGIAAALAMLLGSVFLWQTLKPEELQLLSTGYGEIIEQVLSDGTEVSLNANSEIRFSANWDGSSKREVWLEGEAFFDVTHNPDVPFVVHTSRGDIRVLGTQFNALQRAEVLRVALVEGSVSLTPQGHPAKAVLMQPGEEFRLSEEGFSLESADLEPISAWKDHKMIFREESIAAIAEKLKWDFNLDITFAREEILSRRVNAFIQENDPELLLEALAEIYDLNIQKTGEQTFLIE